MRGGRYWAAGVATAALLTVSACTTSDTHTRPAPGSPAVTSLSAASRTSGPAPIAAATLHTLASVTEGTTITPVTGLRAMRAAVPQLVRSQAAAIRAALEYDRRGSKIVGITLAQVVMDGPGFNHWPRLVWLVSVDPYGGAFV